MPPHVMEGPRQQDGCQSSNQRLPLAEIGQRQCQQDHGAERRNIDGFQIPLRYECQGQHARHEHHYRNHRRALVMDQAPHRCRQQNRQTPRQPALLIHGHVEVRRHAPKERSQVEARRVGVDLSESIVRHQTPADKCRGQRSGGDGGGRGPTAVPALPDEAN